MKSSFQQIQISKKDRHKTTFTVSFGHYEWNVKPFKLKNSLFQFQHILNNYSKFSIVYIHDVLIYSKILNQHFKHLKIFFNKRNVLAISGSQIKLFQTKIRLLGHQVFNIIQPYVKFVDKSIDEFKMKINSKRF